MTTTFGMVGIRSGTNPLTWTSQDDIRTFNLKVDIPTRSPNVGTHGKLREDLLHHSIAN